MTIDATSSISNNLRFPGQFADEETGLHYNWNRYYNPETGRYQSKDPIGLAGGDTNYYRYVQNNPVNLTDATGTTLIPAIIGGAIGGIAGGTVAIVNGSSVVAGVGVGAATGSLAGLTLGASLGAQTATAAAIGGVAGFLGDLGSQLVSGSKNIDWSSATLALAIGTASGGIGAAVGFVDAAVGAMVGGVVTTVGSGFQFNLKPNPCR